MLVVQGPEAFLKSLWGSKFACYLTSTPSIVYIAGKTYGGNGDLHLKGKFIVNTIGYSFITSSLISAQPWIVICFVTV